MAKKTVSKTKLIHDFLEKDPSATWKTAKEALEKHGINGNYFSLQKGKWKNGAASGSTSAPKAAVTRGPKPAAAKASAGGTGLVQAADFARTVGGIDEAKKLLEQLGAMQV